MSEDEVTYDEAAPIPETPPECEGYSNTNKILIHKNNTGPCPNCAAPETRWEVEDCDHGGGFEVHKRGYGSISHGSTEDDAKQIALALNERTGAARYEDYRETVAALGRQLARAEAAERLNGELIGLVGEAVVLAENAEHVLSEHDCDRHGYEGIKRASTAIISSPHAAPFLARIEAAGKEPK